MNSIVKDIGVELEGYVPKALVGITPKTRNYSECLYKMKEFMTVPSRLTGANEGTIRMPGLKKCHSTEDYNKYPLVCYEWKYYGNHDDLKRFLKVMYEQYKFKANSSCGFHMHLNIDRGDYPIIITKDFHDEFLTRYKRKFGKIEKYANRIDHNKCGWCIPDYDSFVSGHRTMFTLPLYHKTLEVRVMPYQRNWKEAMGSIKWVNDTFDDIYSEMCDIPKYWETGLNLMSTTENCIKNKYCCGGLKCEGKIV